MSTSFSGSFSHWLMGAPVVVPTETIAGVDTGVPATESGCERPISKLTNIPSGVSVASDDYLVGYRPGSKGIRFPFSALFSLIATGPVASVFGRTGAIVSKLGDYSASDITGLGTSATKNVGTTAGTVAAGDNTHRNLTMNNIILRNATTGTLWKMSLKGDSDGNTVPRWEPV